MTILWRFWTVFCGFWKGFKSRKFNIFSNFTVFYWKMWFWVPEETNQRKKSCKAFAIKSFLLWKASTFSASLTCLFSVRKFQTFFQVNWEISFKSIEIEIFCTFLFCVCLNSEEEEEKNTRKLTQKWRKEKSPNQFMLSWEIIYFGYIEIAFKIVWKHRKRHKDL